MKLRLNLIDEDIGYCFAVHVSTVSRTIIAVLDILYGKLKPVVMWPNREDRVKTMRMCFRKHCPSCAVINPPLACAERVTVVVSCVCVCVCVCVCLSVCLSEHAILAVRAIRSITKDAIVLSVRFAAILKRRFS